MLGKTIKYLRGPTMYERFCPITQGGIPTKCSITYPPRLHQFKIQIIHELFKQRYNCLGSLNQLWNSVRFITDFTSMTDQCNIHQHPWCQHHPCFSILWWSLPWIQQRDSQSELSSLLQGGDMNHSHRPHHSYSGLRERLEVSVLIPDFTLCQ